MNQTCIFNKCTKIAVQGSNKCTAHKHRAMCSFPGCCKQTVKHSMCARHGGKRYCWFPNCKENARGGKFCLQHGGVAKVRLCIIEGCKKHAHLNRKCIRHGGGRYCSAPGCSLHARGQGLCHRHQAGNISDDEGSIAAIDESILNMLMQPLVDDLVLNYDASADSSWWIEAL